jgi:hypothetical protein
MPLMGGSLSRIQGVPAAHGGSLHSQVGNLRGRISLTSLRSMWVPCEMPLSC